MYFTRPEPDSTLRRTPPLNYAIMIGAFGLFFGVVGDAALQANGLYGSRTQTVETVIDKRMVPGRRNSRTPTIFIEHRGERLSAQLLVEQYDRIDVGDRLKLVIVPGRIGKPWVYLDTPGLKLDPHARLVGFGVIIVVHATLLFGLFRLLMRRARERESTASSAFQSRRLGLTRS